VGGQSWNARDPGGGIKSLRLDFFFLPTPEIFNLILSFPLLEDLSVVTNFKALTGDDGGSGGLLTAVQPPNPPTFTGSLDLTMCGGMGYVTNWLLSFSGGTHFRKLTLTRFHEADGSLIAALVRVCSDTLESLKITAVTFRTSIQHLLPLQQLISVPSRVEVKFDRPLESKETRGHSASVQHH